MPAEPGANEQDWNQRSQPQTLNSHQSAPLVSRYAAIVSEHEGNSHESENSQRVGRRNPPFAVDSANERPSEGGQQYASRYGKRHEQAQCPIKSLREPLPREPGRTDAAASAEHDMSGPSLASRPDKLHLPLMPILETLECRAKV